MIVRTSVLSDYDDISVMPDGTVIVRQRDWPGDVVVFADLAEALAAISLGRVSALYPEPESGVFWTARAWAARSRPERAA